MNLAKCDKCHCYLVSEKLTSQQVLCYDCRNLCNNIGSVRHNKLARCPKCRHQQFAEGEFNYVDIYEDEHHVTCEECKHEYYVAVLVSVRLESPEIIDSD